MKRSRSGWDWEVVGEATYRVEENRLMIAVPRAMIGQEAAEVSFDFHWADNIQKEDDLAEFFDSGDSAPNRRFNYRYRAQGG